MVKNFLIILNNQPQMRLKLPKYQPSKFRTNNRVGIIMIHGEHIIPIVELSLILQF